MRYKDTIQLHGVLSVTVFETKNGYKEKLFRHTKRNQVTDLGREVVLSLLMQDPAGDIYQANPEYNQIWYLALGDGTTPPDRTDTALGNQLWIDPIARPAEYTLTYNPLWEIKIDKILPAGDLPNNFVSEAALFTKGDGIGGSSRMYARQTHAIVATTPTMIIEYEWRLGVTIQI